MLIPSCLIKLLELMLTVACLTLHQYSYDLTDLTTLMLCSGTYVGYLIVLSGEIIGEAVSATADPYVNAWWSATGAALFGASGAHSMSWWRGVPPCPRKTYAGAAAIVAMVTAGVLLVDTLMSFCEAHRDDHSEK
ncbi:uncharacterized protein LOC121732468 isoform X2 [Aricia agestis]|uniref:uncharacterized protein LOC121732468 isoform X2 n=1 Tax=Aricia agestis TaxID=91739 RepID=UPI001C20A8CF|nr:uncharacterized protein LOC121732468 isoform X2 [Aricia agestis]